MAFQVKPFTEVLKMTEKALDTALAPIRARAAKAKANVVTAEIEEEMVSLENQIHEACAEKEINFDRIIGHINKYELAERKKKQVAKLMKELFPDG